MVTVEALRARVLTEAQEQALSDIADVLAMGGRKNAEAAEAIRQVLAGLAA